MDAQGRAGDTRTAEELDHTARAVPPGIDVTKPSIARVYDYALGGKDNYAVDRELAEKLFAQVPDARAQAQANRAFLGRAVRYLAEHGIRQFVDLGTGLPTQDNVHQVAQRVAPDARVVYVDRDPVVLAHGRALLADNARTTVIDADLTEAKTVLAHPELTNLIDLSQPVGVLFLAVLHFVPDDEQARRIAESYADALASGSYVAISHLAARPDTTEAARAYAAAVSPIQGRTCAQTERLFEGVALEPPGVVDARVWPEPIRYTPDALLWAGIGHT